MVNRRTSNILVICYKVNNLKSYKKFKSQILRIENIAKLKHIYIKNGWKEKTDSGDNQFDRFCQLLACFNEDQQNLIIDLTNDFIQVGLSNYIPLYTHTFELLLKELPDDKLHNKLVFFPAIMPDDMNKSKSAQALLYMIKGELNSFQNKTTSLYLRVIDNYNMLEMEKDKDKCFISIVDDFIGTGQTMLGIVEKLEHIGFLKEQIYATALVAQEMGIKSLNAYGISAFATIIRKRGMSDNPKYTESHIKIMKQIETKWKLTKSFNLDMIIRRLLSK